MAEPVAPQEKPFSTSIPVFASAQAPAVSEEYLHELRVRIPVDLHRQLLSLKVLRGKSLAETVSLALDIYFAEHAKQVTEVTSVEEH